MEENKTISQEDLEQLMRDAELGDADAQHNLAYCYEYGDGVVQDIDKAIYWYKKAAEQEFVPAQVSLGNIYYYGEGVEQDDEKAMHWFTQAAELGDERAQCKLVL